MSNSALTKAVSRIKALLDEGSFVEVGSYVTARNTDFGLNAAETPADGVATGYGTIGGSLVYVYSQEPSVLGGSIGEMHAKKISGIYDMAVRMGAPVIGLIDCAGLRLQEGVDALGGFGQLYLAQTGASGVVPQIAAVFGTCGGGMAVSCGLADFVFMEKGHAKLFVNSPNAIEGNYIEKCDTSGADFQSKSGLADFVGTEEEIIAGIRSLVGVLPANNEDDLSYSVCADDLNRLNGGIEGYKGAADAALAAISDGGFYLEVKKACAPALITAFIRLNGQTVGCVANRTEAYDETGTKTDDYDAVICPTGADKAASFISFCDAFNIPVLTLVNVHGYAQCENAEKKMARSAAKLTSAYACASVPVVTVVTGEAFGTAGITMGSKAIGADIVYAWPSAKIGMMDAAQAVKIIYADEIASSDDAGALIKEKSAEYASLQSGAEAAARRGYVDDIIDPAETRKRVIAALEMLATKRVSCPDRKHSVV